MIWASAYYQEFNVQLRQFESNIRFLLAAPTSKDNDSFVSFRTQIDFIAHVADCYPEDTRNFPDELIGLFSQHHDALEAETREKIVGCLVLLRRKNLISSDKYAIHILLLYFQKLEAKVPENRRLLETFFPILLNTKSKSLRSLLYHHFIVDVRFANSKTKNHPLNRKVQNLLYNLIVLDRSSLKAFWAVRITRELWRKQIWTESKAVEIMKEASVSSNQKVTMGGVRFFLGADKEIEEAENDSGDEVAIDIGRLKHQIGINKKSRKASRALDKASSTVKRKEKKKTQPHPLNFSALHLLHDPQGFAESLFSQHLQSSRSTMNLENRLQLLQLVSRLVGFHRLTILGLYSWFIKYLTPRQPSVTSILASLAQATHPLVPPDTLEPLVQKIANEFISEAAAGEVAAAGLNAVREICVRQPLAMNDVLLQDLIMYKKSKDRGVMMASKGLLSLYREVGASMLKKRDRGKEASMAVKNGQRQEMRFGEQPVGDIEGLDLLAKWKQEERVRKRAEAGLGPEVDDEKEDDGEDDGAWEVDESEPDDSEGWINVESDKEIDISDSDDEGHPSKKHKPDPDPSNGSDKENKPIEPVEDTEKTVSLATNQILTPADLVKLHELRLEASINMQLPQAQRKRLAQVQKTIQDRHIDDPLTATEIEGLASLSKKVTKEDKIDAAKQGKTDKKEHQSTQAIRKAKKESQGKSTTNKEKARKKNFLMTLGKAKGKQKRSLVDRSKTLKAHVERSKRGGRRGNKGR